MYLRGDANGGSIPVVFILGLFAVAAVAGDRLGPRWAGSVGGDGAPDRPASSRRKLAVDRPVSGTGNGQMSRPLPASGTIRS
jgi:hypothetical protein